MSALDDTETPFQLIIPITGCVESNVRSCSYEIFMDTEDLLLHRESCWL